MLRVVSFRSLPKIYLDLAYNDLAILPSSRVPRWRFGFGSDSIELDPGHTSGPM